jgi:DNA-binding NtrC family response regulator
MIKTEPLQRRWVKTGPDGGLLERRFWLEWVTGPRAGERHAVSSPLTVGSGEQAEICLSESTLSRQHVELSPRAEGLHVRDLGSTNGTYVGGVRLTEAVLEHDAVLVLGRVRARVLIEEARLDAESPRFGKLATSSPSMRRLLGQAAAVAAADVPVLIEGPTGSGKELFAHELHEASLRQGAPWVVIDCRALAPSLADSELFGHVRGAFSGADTDRVGLLEQAGAGTVLLDEVGELPLELQPRLLRVLEAGRFRRVGDGHELPFRARVIATTCHHLEERVARGAFRQDLFFRLAVVQLTLPSLNERAEDLPELVQAFCAELGQPGVGFSAATLSALASRSWPGNVRQLRALVERCLTAGPRPETVEPFRLDALLGARAVDDGEKRRVLEALAKHGGNQTLAAKELGMARGTLLARMDAFGIARPRKHG